MRLNVNLNEELGTRIFSFPMRYQPINRPDRGHVGDKWNSYFLRSIQVILQATHGIVSGNPEFFYEAFGSSADEFNALLIRPHHFIFNRFWYEKYGGRAEFEEYQSEISKLSKTEKDELMFELSQRKPNKYAELKFSNKRLQKILRFYYPLPRGAEQEIWKKQKELLANHPQERLDVPEDEKVEDAGYDEDESSQELDSQLITMKTENVA